jgi:hypothetical protein
MKGVYQHCHEKHLHRYLSEFDFRYSNRIALGTNDVVRAERAIKGAKASGSHTGNLIKKNFSRQARRFLRWRKRRKQNG